MQAPVSLLWLVASAFLASAVRPDYEDSEATRPTKTGAALQSASSQKAYAHAEARAATASGGTSNVSAAEIAAASRSSFVRAGAISNVSSNVSTAEMLAAASESSVVRAGAISTVSSNVNTGDMLVAASESSIVRAGAVSNAASNVSTGDMLAAASESSVAAVSAAGKVSSNAVSAEKHVEEQGAFAAGMDGQGKPHVSMHGGGGSSVKAGGFLSLLSLLPFMIFVVSSIFVYQTHQNFVEQGRATRVGIKSLICCVCCPLGGSCLALCWPIDEVKDTRPGEEDQTARGSNERPPEKRATSVVHRPTRTIGSPTF